MSDEEIMEQVTLIAEQVKFGELGSDEAVDKISGLLRDRSSEEN